MKISERLSTLRGIVEYQMGKNQRVALDKFRMRVYSNIHQSEEIAYLKKRMGGTIFEPQPDQP